MNRTSLRSRAWVVVTGVMLVVAALSGCSNAPADLQGSTASRLQTGVLEVSTRAAGGDYAAAQSALNAVQGDLLTAASAGTVSAPRAAQIQSAINQVGADLSAAIEASKPTPTPAPVVTVEAPPPTDSGRKNGNGNGDGNGNGKGGESTCKKKDDC